MKKCSITSCERRNHAKGFCNIHYYRHAQGQDLLKSSPRDPRPALITGDTALIPVVSKGKIIHAKVDKDHAYLDKYKWYLNANGYAAALPGKLEKHIVLHKMILPVEKPYVVDHVNHDLLDNRRANLRKATRAQNNYNRKAQGKQGLPKGVYADKTSKLYRARITIDRKMVHIGSYPTIEEAKEAYDNKARLLHEQYFYAG